MASLGSAIWFVIAPGTLAGLIPWIVTGWRRSDDFRASPLLWSVGLTFVVVGLAGLIECFARFALRGHGTPAPVAAPTLLVVSGLYRFVRNPMYVALVTLLIGEGLLFRDGRLAIYTAVVWFAFHLFVTMYEEPALRRQFPEDFRLYSAAVRRWLPRLSPYEAPRRLANPESLA